MNRPPRALPILALCAAGLLAACGSSNTDDAAPPAQAATVRLDDGAVRVSPASMRFIGVETVSAEQGAVSLHAPGRIEFREGAVTAVIAPIDARVVAVHASLGDIIEPGQKLLTIQGPEIAQLRSDFDRARNAMRAAETEHKRQERLHERGIGVEANLYAAQVALADARSEFDSLKQAVEFVGPVEDSPSTAVVNAPVGGMILSLAASPGATVGLGDDSVMEIGDPDALWAVAEVYEQDLWATEVGSIARIEVGPLRERIEGRVVRIGPVVDQQMRRAPVYLEMERNGLPLRQGMFIRAELESARVEGVSLPPAAVLIRDQREHIVFVRVGEDTFEPRAVTVGRTVGGRVQVIDGIEAGDEVVTTGALLLDNTADQLL